MFLWRHESGKSNVYQYTNVGCGVVTFCSCFEKEQGGKSIDEQVFGKKHYTRVKVMSQCPENFMYTYKPNENEYMN